MSYPRKQSPEAWASQLNFAAIERQHGLPAGILTNLVRQESGGDTQARSHVGAFGLCQFMPATARERGVNANDPVSSANGAAKYLEDLMDMFGGDVDKAIASYNWGQGNMRRAIRNHGANWREAMPAETKNYLRVVGRGVSRSFAQRQEAGETVSAEEQEDEATRRRSRLAEAGVPQDLTENMSMSGLLGSLFFALIASFITQKLDAQEQQPATTAPVTSIPSQIIASIDASAPAGAPRTPAVPRTAAAASRSVVPA